MPVDAKTAQEKFEQINTAGLFDCLTTIPPPLAQNRSQRMKLVLPIQHDHGVVAPAIPSVGPQIARAGRPEKVEIHKVRMPCRWPDAWQVPWPYLWSALRFVAWSRNQQEEA